MAFRYEERSRRAWARVAGLMYLLVLAADLTGMQLPSPVLGRSLMLAGSLCTVPLALGLYFALRAVLAGVARVALSCRLVEAALGITATVAGYGTIHGLLAATQAGRAVLTLIAWDHRVNFSALIFTVGSTLFFFLFVKCRCIPAVLSWLGLVASLIAFAACAIHLLRPGFPAMTMAAWIPMLLAEISTGLWLLLCSVRAEVLARFPFEGKRGASITLR